LSPRTDALSWDRASFDRWLMAFADKTLNGRNHAAPPFSAARVSLTLALGYLVVLGGT